MIDTVCARKKSNLLYFFFGIENLSNFPVVKSLRKFGSCLVDSNTFFSFESRF